MPKLLRLPNGDWINPAAVASIEVKWIKRYTPQSTYGYDVEVALIGGRIIRACTVNHDTNAGEALAEAQSWCNSIADEVNAALALEATR